MSLLIFIRLTANRLERTAGGDDVVESALRLEVIGGLPDLDAERFGEAGAYPGGEFGVGVHARADGGAAKRDLAEFFLGFS